VARKGLRPKVKWPLAGKPVEEYSDAELLAVAIHPMATGLGQHPRSVSDEAWAASCLRVVRERGLAQFLTDLLQVLRLTADYFIGPAGKVGEYPRVKTPGDLPLPLASHPGDRTWGTKWTEGMVVGAMCNPVLAGIPPFPAIMSDRKWISGMVGAVKQRGTQQFLVDLLYVLKRSYGAPGVDAVIPFGYKMADE
jgi:hypothetical protein